MIQVLTNQVDYGPKASKGSQHMTNHSGIWKCLRKTTSNAQGCFIAKCYFANISMRICLIFFVSRLFPFDVGDFAFLPLQSTNEEHKKQGKLLNLPPESWYTFSCFDAGSVEYKEEMHQSRRVPTDLEQVLRHGWTPTIIIRARDKELELAKVSIFVLKNPFIPDHTDMIGLSLSKEPNTGFRVALKRTRRIEKRGEDKRFKPPDLDQDKHQDVNIFMLIKESPPDATNKTKPSQNKFRGMALIFHDYVSDLLYFNAGKLDLRSNPFQVGEDDMIMPSTKSLERGEGLEPVEHHEPELEPEEAKLVAEDSLEYEDVVAVLALVLIQT